MRITPRDDMPKGLRWAMYTSYFWYGFSGLMVNEFEDKEYGHHVLEDMGMLDVNKFICLAILFGVWVNLQMIAFLLLKLLNVEQR